MVLNSSFDYKQTTVMPYPKQPNVRLDNEIMIVPTLNNI